MFNLTLEVVEPPYTKRGQVQVLGTYETRQEAKKALAESCYNPANIAGMMVNQHYLDIVEAEWQPDPGCCQCRDCGQLYTRDHYGQAGWQCPACEKEAGDAYITIPQAAKLAFDRGIILKENSLKKACQAGRWTCEKRIPPPPSARVLLWHILRSDFELYLSSLDPSNFGRGGRRAGAGRKRKAAKEPG